VTECDVVQPNQLPENTMKNAIRWFSIVAATILCSWNHAYAQGFASVTNLNSLTVSAITGEKPQSKVWNYAGRWWAVMPNSSGTQIWRLDGST